MKQVQFRKMTTDVMYNKDLTPTEKLVFTEITALSSKNNYCYASNEYLSKKLNCDVRQIINRLKKKGLIITKEMRMRQIIVVNNNENKKHQPAKINTSDVSKVDARQLKLIHQTAKINTPEAASQNPNIIELQQDVTPNFSAQAQTSNYSPIPNNKIHIEQAYIPTPEPTKTEKTGGGDKNSIIDNTIRYNNNNTNISREEKVSCQLVVDSELVKTIANRISMPTKELINRLMNEKGKEYIECSIQYALAKAKSNFDAYLCNTLNNQWATHLIADTKNNNKAEQQRIQKEKSEKEKAKLEEEKAKLARQKQDTHRNNVEHEFYKLISNEQDKYLRAAEHIIEKFGDKLAEKNYVAEKLVFSIYAVSNNKQYNTILEMYCDVCLCISLDIKKIKYDSSQKTTNNIPIDYGASSIAKSF